MAWCQADLGGAPEGMPAAARDDGEQALRIAKDCGYAWGEGDAADLVAETALALGDRAYANRLRAEADAWRDKLRVPEGYVWPPAKCWSDLDP